MLKLLLGWGYIACLSFFPVNGSAAALVEELPYTFQFKIAARFQSPKSLLGIQPLFTLQYAELKSIGELKQMLSKDTRLLEIFGEDLTVDHIKILFLSYELKDCNVLTKPLLKHNCFMVSIKE